MVAADIVELGVGSSVFWCRHGWPCDVVEVARPINSVRSEFNIRGAFIQGRNLLSGPARASAARYERTPAPTLNTAVSAGRRRGGEPVEITNPRAIHSPVRRASSGPMKRPGGGRSESAAMPTRGIGAVKHRWGSTVPFRCAMRCSGPRVAKTLPPNPATGGQSPGRGSWSRRGPRRGPCLEASRLGWHDSWPRPGVPPGQVPL